MKIRLAPITVGLPFEAKRSFDAQSIYPLNPPMQSTDGGSSITSDRAHAQDLCQAGAIMTTPGFPPNRFLVGQLIWREDNSLVWFTAFGDSATDAHALRFDEIRRIECRGICFLKEGNPVGLLGTIDSAGVDDPDDYRVAWELWQQIEPLKKTTIEQWCSTRLGSDSSRDGSP